VCLGVRAGGVYVCVSMGVGVCNSECVCKRVRELVWASACVRV